MNKIRLNAIALYLYFIAQALIGIFVNPLLVKTLGSTEFGIWKACLRIIDIAAVADGRATQALKWIIASHDSKQDNAAKQRIVGAAIAIWFIWLPVFTILSLTIVYFLPFFVKDVSSDNLLQVRYAVVLMCINVFSASLFGVSEAVLVGSNQGFRSYFMSSGMLFVTNALMVVVAYRGYGLVGLGYVAISGTVLNGFAAWLIVRRYVTWWGIRVPKFSDIQSFLGFSNWTLLWSLVQIGILSTEILLISFLSGAEDTSRYIFTSYVIQFSLSICLMTGSAVAPRIGQHVGSGDMDSAKLLYRRTRTVLIFFISVFSGTTILFNESFISVWVGSEFYLGNHVNIMLVALMAQLALIRYESQIQDVSLKIRLKVSFGMISAFLSIILAILLYSLTQSILYMLIGVFLGRLPILTIFPWIRGKTVKGTTPLGIDLLWIITFIAASAAIDVHYDPSLLMAPLVVCIIIFVAGFYAFMMSGRELRTEVSRKVLRMFRN